MNLHLVKFLLILIFFKTLVARVSAIQSSQMEKKPTPPKKARGKKAVASADDEIDVD